MSRTFPTASQRENDQRKDDPKFSERTADVPKLSVNHATTLRWTFEEAVVRYRLAEIDAIGVWLPKLIEFGEDEAQDWLSKNGMAVSTLSYAGGFTGAFGHDLDDVIEETRDWIALAGRLQASSLVVVSGPINNHITKHATRLVVDSLKELADDAADFGVTLSLLPMRKSFGRDWTFLNSLDEALAVLDRVNHPNVQLAFDAYHLWPEKGLLQRLPEFVSRIGVVQMSDAPATGRTENERVLPGEGILPVEAVLSKLIDAGYRGYVDYQIWSETLWKSVNHDWLRRCRENFTRLCPVSR